MNPGLTAVASRSSVLHSNLTGPILLSFFSSAPERLEVILMYSLKSSSCQKNNYISMFVDTEKPKTLQYDLTVKSKLRWRY